MFKAFIFTEITIYLKVPLSHNQEMNYQQKAQDFLKISSEFSLGHLVTESFHPLTNDLSELVKKDISLALSRLKQVDQEALDILSHYRKSIWPLYLKIQQVFKANGRIFLCGCGATGRLSLALETLYRQKYPGSNRVFSFMAGGDFALIKSVESFEDRPEYGERQLLELGFNENDLLIASSEGGETPFVIGAAIKSSQISKHGAYFLYCNPDDLLLGIKRCHDVLTHPKISKINLTVGPMAISGSTRMQASSVLMFAIGMGLLYEYLDEDHFNNFFEDQLLKFKEVPFEKLSFFTQFEAEAYLENKFINYVADANLAISVLTDTTERSPTFSLPGFENKILGDENKSLSYLFVKGTKNSDEAWKQLLQRDLRALSWEELQVKINKEIVLGFDISESGLKHRSLSCDSKNFIISAQDDLIVFEFESMRTEFQVGDDLLSTHLILKMLLNAHSTLIMGLLERYEGNVMTYVRPSNNKLIDRAARYIQKILKDKNKIVTYEDIVFKIFEVLETQDSRPVVLRVVDCY